MSEHLPQVRTNSDQVVTRQLQELARQFDDSPTSPEGKDKLRADAIHWAGSTMMLLLRKKMTERGTKERASAEEIERVAQDLFTEMAQLRASKPTKDDVGVKVELQKVLLNLDEIGFEDAWGKAADLASGQGLVELHEAMINIALK